MSRQPRRGWVACLLALICPGLGHVYGGQRGLGVVLMLVATMLQAAIMLLWLVLDLDLFTGIVVAAAVGLIYWIAQAVSATAHARHVIIEYPRPLGQRLLAYLGFFLVAAALGHLVNDRLVRGRLFESFKMPSESMLPNVLPGDVLLVDKFSEQARFPRRGDIIVFNGPHDDQPYVKRLIARSGANITAEGDQLRIDGELVVHQGCDPPDLTCFVETSLDRIPYRIRIGHESGRVPFAGSPSVPEDQLYVLGDNRNNSHDSRQFGTVPLENYQGLVAGVLYSMSAEDGFRWDRIGLRF